MVIEFIGVTGAGKTQLVRAVQKAAVRHRPSAVASDLVMDHFALRAVTNASAANVVQDIAGLPLVLRSWPRRREFLSFCAGMILRHGPNAVEKAASMRSVLRRLGLHERAVRRPPGELVLLDEGIVLAAYHLFVYGKVDFERRDLAEFARLVPLPDAVVYVRAPLAQLVTRAVERRDPRRQLAGKGHTAVERSLQRAVDMFDGLVATEHLRGRVVAVENPDSGGAPPAALVDRLTGELLARAARADHSRADLREL